MNRNLESLVNVFNDVCNVVNNILELYENCQLDKQNERISSNSM